MWVDEAKDLISKLTIINENEDNNEQTLPFTIPRSPTSDRMRPTILKMNQKINQLVKMYVILCNLLYLF